MRHRHEMKVLQQLFRQLGREDMLTNKFDWPAWLELFTLRSTEMPLLYRNQFQFGLYFLRTSIRMNGLVIRENILQIQRNFVFRLLLWLSKCTRMCVRICWHGQILTPLRGHPAARYVHWNTSIMTCSIRCWLSLRLVAINFFKKFISFPIICKFLCLNAIFQMGPFCTKRQEEPFIK